MPRCAKEPVDCITASDITFFLKRGGCFCFSVAVTIEILIRFIEAQKIYVIHRLFAAGRSVIRVFIILEFRRHDLRFLRRTESLIIKLCVQHFPCYAIFPCDGFILITIRVSVQDILGYKGIIFTGIRLFIIQNDPLYFFTIVVAEFHGIFLLFGTSGENQ